MRPIFRLMNYNDAMKYEELSGKPILLLGKTKALNGDEFDTMLRLHRIGLVREYEEGVALVVEGRMMNPYEQAESARLYEAGVAPIVSIEGLEEWLCRSIEPNRLLMSLKLSRDQQRLVDFLKNPYITDELFYKLLRLYDWQNEGLFDNDRNRDVTASIIGRFYTDLARNHNVQYAMSGLAHLIERYGTAELIGAVAELSPIAKELRESRDRSLGGILDAMALHPATPEAVLRLLIHERFPLLARREPLSLEEELLNLGNVDEELAQNPTLSAAGATRLMERHPFLIARHFPLNREIFEALWEEHASALASNPSLTAQMQEMLMQRGGEDVCTALAANSATKGEFLRQLSQSGRYGRFLASNEALSSVELEGLYHTADPAILEALAANPSTPIELLYQLSLDRRFERRVKTNPAFGKHIQTHNIGWH